MTLRRLASSGAATGADHYSVLGIRRDAKQKDVKEAFYKLSKLYHPDVSSDAVALQKFQDITAAYETLGTAESRDAYDMATQPQRSQRLSGATVVRSTRGGHDEQTLAYKLRRQAHDRMRVRAQAAAAGGGAGPRRAAPSHYVAGSFDEELLQQMRQRSSADLNAEDVPFAERHSSFLVAICCIVVAIALLSSPREYVPRGHRLSSAARTSE